MMICSPISTSTKNVTCLIWSVRRRMSNHAFDVIQAPSTCRCFHSLNMHPKLPYTSMSVSSSDYCLLTGGSKASRRISIACKSENKTTRHSLAFNIVNPKCHQRNWMSVSLSTGFRIMSTKLPVPEKIIASKIKYNIGPVSWQQRQASAGFFIALLVCFSTTTPTHAEAPEGNEKEKKVFTDYSVTGIPGDGRCLFRSIVHGACVLSGKNPPNETLQREMADGLRARVADELVKRREETEWFIEGDFDTYVSSMRKPHEWGGEPELLMASHVLHMPITVYMYDRKSGGLISIAEYGQEYGKDNPIEILYHGSGHYDALHIHGRSGARSRL
ncbi:OVARIAN TUMOR DOMAIN-containing deubiquitinating enzyme 4-like [Primulina tabacum]|uniref:OVARIAN TUMOR DOMAIN-containing deubiquitinating enzyme 4-like n=1 Tax=Primulina tabacum TaxID=48773 RepID=UPI003F5A7C5D